MIVDIHGHLNLLFVQQSRKKKANNYFLFEKLVIHFHLQTETLDFVVFLLFFIKFGTLIFCKKCQY